MYGSSHPCLEHMRLVVQRLHCFIPLRQLRHVPLRLANHVFFECSQARICFLKRRQQLLGGPKSLIRGLLGLRNVGLTGSFFQLCSQVLYLLKLTWVRRGDVIEPKSTNYAEHRVARKQTGSLERLVQVSSGGEEYVWDARAADRADTLEVAANLT